MRKTKVLFISSGGFCIVLFFLTFFARAEKLVSPATIIPSILFGQHIHRATSTTVWPIVPFKSWRLWDTYATWSKLEPTKGEWHFENLDNLVALAEKNNVEVLLPLGLTPDWASARPKEKSAYSNGNAAEPLNIEDWKIYVRKVGNRYKGRIHYYEIWNEPNLKEFFSGTPEQLIVLSREAYQILKLIDPAIVMVSPSATSGYKGVAWLKDYFAKGGGKYADIIGFHFYTAPNPPEMIVPLIGKVKNVMAEFGASNKPLWNTEAGWAIANKQTEVKTTKDGIRSKVLNDEEASAYVARAYILNWASGVERFYWYAWDNGLMGLTDADGKTVKNPAFAYGEIQKWLVGARMDECLSESNGTWICHLTRDGGYNARIVWNPVKQVTLKIPKSWGIKVILNLDGKKQLLDSPTSVQIGLSPVLLENSSR